MHSVHLNSINPSPWTSLSMRPIEHLLYFSEMAWHVLIPSNPIIALFHMHVVGYGAINGHFGFDKLEITDVRALDSHAYALYLHHKCFEMNYAVAGLTLFMSIVLTDTAAVSLAAPAWAKAVFGKFYFGSYRVIIAWWLALTVIYIYFRN